MQKVLLGLLVIWVGITVIISLDNLKLREESEDQLQRRAFIVYSRTLMGCMSGAEFVKASYAFPTTYRYCVDLSYREKDIYVRTSK